MPADTPVTIPAALTVALPLLAAHVPPGSDGVRVMLLPMHTEEKPVIVPEAGSAFTVTGFAVTALPHRFVTVYTITSGPSVAPVTDPEEETVALPVVPAHVPPGSVLVSEEDDPMHIVDEPVIEPASGRAFTVMALVADNVPHTVVEVKLIVAVPVLSPVTRPLVTTAVLVADEDHVPDVPVVV